MDLLYRSFFRETTIVEVYPPQIYNLQRKLGYLLLLKLNKKGLTRSE